MKKPTAPNLKAGLSRATADGAAKGQQFHLAIAGRYLPEYWLHVTIPGARPLGDLDYFPQAIWLECCGHLGGFTINAVHYESAPSAEKLFG